MILLRYEILLICEALLKCEILLRCYKDLGETTCFILVTAIAHLDKVKVWGKNIRVTQSKHTLVQMPKEGQPVSITVEYYQMIVNNEGIFIIEILNDC